MNGLPGQVVVLTAADGGSLVIDRAYVDAHLGELAQDPDLSRYIL